MIGLERQQPKKIPILEAILRRLPEKDGDFVVFEDQLYQAKSGYIGEQRLDREWLDFQIQQPHILLHNVQMKNEADFTHQIDTLLLTQYFVLVLEAKNYSGRIEFDEEMHQCIRIRADGSINGFSNPIDQVKRHMGFIKSEIRRLGFALPVEGAIVFTNTNSVLGNVKSNVHLFHVTGLRYKLSKLFEKYCNALVSEKQLQWITNEFIARQHRQKWVPEIDVSKLYQGVLCGSCNYSTQMYYKQGKWTCKRCGKVDATALLEALHDYRLLWSPSISNGEFREFVGIKCEKTAYRILKKLNLESRGKLRHKKYLIPADILEMSDRV